VVNIVLPPLRDRLEDIPILVDHFVDKFRAEKQKDIVGVDDEVIALLMKYNYPGNIRELENIIEYGFILCSGGYIRTELLPDTFLNKEEQPESPLFASYQNLTLEDLEKKAIALCLDRNKWKKMRTCKELGISKDTLRRKIKRYDLINPLD